MGVEIKPGQTIPGGNGGAPGTGTPGRPHPIRFAENDTPKDLKYFGQPADKGTETV